MRFCPKVLWWISNYYQSNYNQNKTEVTEQQESCFLRVRKVRKTFGINFEGIEENWTRSKEKTKQIASSILHVQFTFLEGNLIYILRNYVMKNITFPNPMLFLSSFPNDFVFFDVQQKLLMLKWEFPR